MNMDILEGKWKQIKGGLMQWRARRSKSDLGRLEGARVQLLAMTQLHAGQARAVHFRRDKRR